jgi:drug/metabolite transporter (DMT)-like permease
VTQIDRRHGLKVCICLSAVYLIWGSSFLFSKIGASHLPVAMLSGVRFVTAGTLLGLFAHYRGGAVWPRGRLEWTQGLVLGVLMVVASNGLNLWAIQYIPTNQSALLNSTAAFWIAGFGIFGRRGHPLSRRALIGLLIGFVGTVLMLIPNGRIPASAIVAQVAALCGCFSWSVGTVYYRSMETRISPLMLTALQMLSGGLMMLILSFAIGDFSRWHMSAPGLISLGYLTLCSSCLAYTAYGWLSRNTTPPVIGTYSYVNPAIAAFLGWQFLDEHLSGTQLIGMLIVICGVVLLTLPSRFGGVEAENQAAPPRSA